MQKILFGLLCVILSISIEVQAAPSKLIGRQDVLRVEQLVSLGFQSLPQNRKLLIYNLSKAMTVSSDIFWHQASREGLAVRELLVKVWQYSLQDLSQSEKVALETYLFRLLMEHRNYDKFTNNKLVVEGFNQKTFNKMISVAVTRAKALGKVQDASFLLQESNRLKRDMFDLSYRPLLLANPPEDRATQSNTNFYAVGVTEQDVLKLQEEKKLDSITHVQIKDSIAIAYHPRIGELFTDYLSAAEFYLDEALKYANPSETKLIHALKEAFHLGTEQSWKQAYKAWLENKPDDFDFMLGFVETYEDPFGKRRGWESWIVILAKDEQTKNRIDTVRAKADAFEQLMPVDEKFKKPKGFIAPTAEGNDMLFAAGRTGESPFLGKNLFSEPDLVAIGSKSFSNLNLMQDLSQPEQLNSYLAFIADSYKTLMRTADLNLIHKIQVEFHEVLGHGSGKSLDGITDSDLKEIYNPLEEARAEVASLYHMIGDEAFQMGILKDQEGIFRDDLKKAVLISFFTDHILSFKKLADNADSFRQAHQWARQVMLNYLLAKGCLSVKVESTPKLYIEDIYLCRSSLGSLWALIQQEKSTGDYKSAAAMFTDYGKLTEEHKEWRKLIVAELNKQGDAKYKAVLNPSLTMNKGQVELRYHPPSSNPIHDFIVRRVKEIETAKVEVTKLKSKKRYCDQFI